MSAEDITAGAMMLRVASEFWPLIVALAFAIIAVAGLCALFIAAERVRGTDEPEGNVINFEKWRE